MADVLSNVTAALVAAGVRQSAPAAAAPTPAPSTPPWLSDRVGELVLHPSYLPIHESIERHVKEFVDARSDGTPQVREAVFLIVGPSFVERHYASVQRAPQVLHEPFMLRDFREGLLSDLKQELSQHVSDALSREGTFSGDAYRAFRRAVGDQIDSAMEGAKTETLAGALASVLEADPSLWSKVRSLAGHALPTSLRRSLWHHSLHDATVTRAVDARLAKKTGEPSELFNLIRVMNSDIFAKDLYQFRAHSERALEALNEFHVCFQEFSPRILRLLAPLLATFPKASCRELVCMLVKLSSTFAPSPASARPLAMRALRRLKRDDIELWRHIRETFDEERMPRRLPDRFPAAAVPATPAPPPVPTPPLTPSRVPLPPSRDSSVASLQPPTPSRIPLPPSTPGSSRPPSLSATPTPAAPTSSTPAAPRAPATPPPPLKPAKSRYYSTRLRRLMLRIRTVISAARAFREGPEEVSIVAAAIESGFVGTLAYDPLFYTWDQAFLSSWEAALVDAAVACLRGARRELLAAPTAGAIRLEMREQPPRLSTADLQRAGRVK